jgi:hypothetical protein
LDYCLVIVFHHRRTPAGGLVMADSLGARNVPKRINAVFPTNGGTGCAIAARLIQSPRKFCALEFIGIKRWWTIGYLCGASPDRLAAFYRGLKNQICKS